MKQENINQTIRPFSIKSYIEDQKSLITILIAIVGILSPTGYIAGVIYHQVYLNTFGIDSGAFPITLQEAYFYAYIVSVEYISKGISHLISFKALYITLGLLSIYTALAYFGAKAARWKLATDEEETELRKRFDKLFNYLRPSNNDFILACTAIYEYFAWIFNTAYLALILGACWLMIFVGSYYSGQSAATKKFEEYLKSSCTPVEDSAFNRCSKIISSEGVLAEGYLITSQGNRLALLTNEGSLVLSVQPDEKLVRLQSSVGHVK